MGNTRAMLIIAALAAVLLSAFGAERAALCRGERACAGERTLLPAARFFLARGQSKDAARLAPEPAAATPVDTAQAP